MTNKTDKAMTFKSQGVSNSGEVLLGSVEVQEKIQLIIDTYEGALANQDKSISDLQSKLHQSELKIISLESELSTAIAWRKIADDEMMGLNGKNKELEQHIKYLMEDCRVFNINELAEHNLEQQAKGLQDYAHEELSGLSADNIHWMLTRAKGLRKKAKNGDV
jgi:chromosome segregation ATPase